MTVNGVYYTDNTPKKVVMCLETARASRRRIRLFYGKDGSCWDEEFDTIGYVSKSTGTKKIPLLKNNRRSMGGGAILTDCIIRIDTRTKTGQIITVYFDETIKFNHFSVQGSDSSTNVVNDTTGTIYALCKTYTQGKNLAEFMNGKRWKK